MDGVPVMVTLSPEVTVVDDRLKSEAEVPTVPMIRGTALELQMKK
jgi:hypothetical protein